MGVERSSVEANAGRAVVWVPFRAKAESERL